MLALLAGDDNLLPAWLRPAARVAVMVTQSQAVVVAHGAVAALHGAGLATEQRALQLVKAVVCSNSWGTSLQTLIDHDMHKGAASLDQRVRGACALALVRAPLASGWRIERAPPNAKLDDDDGTHRTRRRQAPAPSEGRSPAAAPGAPPIRPPSARLPSHCAWI